jgi:hypothetical protein
MGGSASIYQAVVSQEWERWRLGTGRAQGHDLEGPVPIANDAPIHLGLH